MIAGVATETIVVSTRIMKKPTHSAKSAGHGSFPPVGSVVLWSVAFWGAVSDEGWLTALPNTRPWTIAPMSSFSGQDLMAGPPPTLLPEDSAAADLVPAGDHRDPGRPGPESPLE